MFLSEKLPLYLAFKKVTICYTAFPNFKI